ncbi:MAG: hypothetical protein C0597_13195 [Marinilabiliales bacterium]|nr:MAG: hypothetical protein C0597_13195 [Marinilabiliales bacterium]
MKKILLTTALFLVAFGISQGKETIKSLTIKESKNQEVMKTINVKKEIIINAPAEEIFPLVCPVREYDWIPDWKCKIIYCPNGKNEEGVVFKQNMSSPFIMNKGGGKTTWTTLLFDTANYKVHFKWDNSISTSIYKMELFPIDETHTKCVLDLNYNIINNKGMKSLNENTEYKIGFMIEGLGNMLKYYCENKEMIDLKNSERKAEFVSNLSTREKLVFLHNKIHMKLMHDRDRKSYLKHGVISDKSLRLN